MKRKWDNRLKVGITKGDGDSMNSIGNKTGQSLSSPGVGRDVSRRFFTKGISRIIGLGFLSHFSLLAGKAWAEETSNAGDACPGGGDDYDVCDSSTDPDKCPGGNEPQDQCASDGRNTTDECPGEAPPPDSCPDGGKDNDTCLIGSDHTDLCNPDVAGNDQCESGLEADDKCPDRSELIDYCPGGGTPQDECNENEGLEQDACPGGAAAVDTCTLEKVGDECSSGSSSNPKDGDACKEDHKDQCFIDGLHLTDDTCTTGENTPTGSGATDYCGPVVVSAIYGSDVCIDGSDSQDRCVNSNNANEPEYDVCPGGGDDVDKCVPTTTPPGVFDYCVDGLPATDACNPSVGDKDECPGGLDAADACETPGDEDECPGGGWEEDVCLSGAAPEDECPGGGCAGGDQESRFPPNDGCAAGSSKDVCTVPSSDTAE